MKQLFLRLLSLAMLLGSGLACAASDPVLVVGHKNPDTDSYVAAIAVAYLKTQQGIPAVGVAQGSPNPETRYVLERFNLSTPEVVTSVAGREVFLVDHSDYPQAPADLKNAEVVGIVDHHKLGGISTDKPIEVLVLPVGSTCTLIKRMYEAANIRIPKNIAGAMLSAILSDTVMFKSPTTTPEDRTTAAALAKIAGIDDIQALSMKLYEAGSSELKSLSAKNLVLRDFKTFMMNGRKVGVGQLEVLNLDFILPRRDELVQAMKELKADGYHSVFLMLTDIMKEGSEFVLVTDDVSVVEKGLNVKPQGDSVWIPGMMSRKKQVIPGLERAFR